MKDIQKNASRELLPSALIRLLPEEVTLAVQACGAPVAEELRLHTNRFCTVRALGITYPTRLLLSRTRMCEILQKLCAGSLYAYEASICHGYLSPCHGVRVGVCGRAATEGERIIGISEVDSLIIRIPHRVSIDASMLSGKLLSQSGGGGMLIYAPPGVGKTTLLRAITLDCASRTARRHTVVVDTREELCYGLEDEDLSLSILSAYPRRIGIEIAFRTLGAELIVCDEIGNDSEVDAILAASNCGVPLLASIHGASLYQILSRPSLQKLHQAGVFRYYVGLQRQQNRLCFQITTHGQVDKLPKEEVTV